MCLTSHFMFFPLWHAATFPPQSFQWWSSGNVIYRREKYIVILPLLLFDIYFICSTDHSFQKDTDRSNSSALLRQGSSAHCSLSCPLSTAVSFYGMSKISKRKLSQGFWASPEMPFWELVPLVKWILKAHCESCRQTSADKL